MGRVARFLTAFLATVCLAIPLLADPGDKPSQDETAAKIAKKVAKAQEKARKAEQEPLEADRRALDKFHERVMEYAELHDKQVARLGRPAALDAQEALAAQQALAGSIASRRGAARRGDLFSPAVVPIFRRLIAAELQGPDGLPARAAILEGNPGDERPSVPVKLSVNGEYPTGGARSTVPPSLLLTLPPLPECLHYRFVGRNLILVDSVAQLIVDFLPAAAPPLSSK
jgi:hypothetical protein